MTRVALFAALAAILAGLGVGIWFALAPGDRFAACREGGGGVVGADIGGPFELTAGDGSRVTAEALIDRPTLIYFGYTFCPDFCPRDAANMAEAQRLLAERGVEINTAFVSIDPERDTPEVVEAFARNLSDDMIGLTGSRADVEAAALAYRVYHAKVGDDPEYYLMDHSTFTYLMAPEAGLLDFFRHATPPEEIADRVACYVEALS
jgi:protein SCO1/2